MISGRSKIDIRSHYRAATMDPFPFYVWIHAAPLFLSDIFVGFDNASVAHTFATGLVNALPKNFFDTNDEILVGGNDSVQIFVIKEDYEPEEGWETWAHDYVHMSIGEVLNLNMFGL
jgi:hypothetical protein